MNVPAVSVDMLRRVIGSLPRSIVVTDADGVIVIWNDMAAQLFGWTEAEVAGRSISTVLVPAGEDDSPPVPLDAIEAGESWLVERTVNRRDGSTIRVRAVTRVLHGADGKVEYVVAASEDLSEILLLEQSAQEATRLERVQRQRLELVSAVNEALERSTDLPDLMTQVTSVVVPQLGDWCTLHIFPTPDAAEPVVEVAHVDPSMVRYARELQQRFPYDPESTSGVAKVVRTGESEFYPEITPDLVRDLDTTPEAQRIVDELALRSAIAVPLRKHGQVLGVLQLVMSAGQRRYTEEDLTLAQAVAARIAATLDNRRLREAQARTAAVDARLAALGWQLAAAADLEQVLQVITEDAGEVMDADAVEIGLVFDAEHVHAVRAGTPLTPEAIARFDLYEISGPSAMTRAVRTGERQYVEEGDRDPMQPEARALIASPLFDGEHHSIGVLVFIWHHERRFDEFDRTAIETLSRLCGAAIRRAETSGYSNQLGELTAGMAAARTTGDVAELLRDHGARALRASLANLRLLDPSTKTLRGVIDSTLPRDIAARFQAVHLDDGLPLTDAARDDVSIWVPNPEEYAVSYPDVVPIASEAGIRATAAIPLHDSQGTVIGAVAFAWNAAMDFDAPLRARLATLCDVAAQTIERVSLYEAEHALITSMQRQLLTPLPEVGSLELAAFYEPAAAAVGMGGDWYDAIPLPDGSLVAIVGDIVGHGVEAVASMARLQHLITGLVRTGTPLEEVFRRANAMARPSDPIFATCVLLHIDVAAHRLGVLSAGHPWPLLRTPDGAVHPLTGGRQALIGAAMRSTEMAYVDLPPGSLVLAYTDGLIERRTETIEESIARLADAFAEVDDATPARTVLEQLVVNVAQDHDDAATTDDIAAMVVRSLA
ncbi:SpoIIE family protein phosphatase [Aquihabitans daechungensis]|uniref:SpoIIE family protein phosphatase n=1 Tax=Aquihabitans daechungensis TaxID=1052257 RepID=UPI003BA075B1